MNLAAATKLIQETFFTTLIVAAPVLGTSLVIGLIISIFQTTTSIQEQTLTFVPKFVGIFLALMYFISFIFQVLANFATNLFVSISGVAK